MVKKNLLINTNIQRVILTGRRFIMILPSDFSFNLDTKKYLVSVQQGQPVLSHFEKVLFKLDVPTLSGVFFRKPYAPHIFNLVGWIWTNQPNTSVETLLVRWLLAVAVNNVASHPLLSFSDLINHLEDIRIGVFLLHGNVWKYRIPNSVLGTKMLLHQEVQILG